MMMYVFAHILYRSGDACVSKVICMDQERRKALKSGVPQRLNRIDLYGKNLTPTEKLYNLGGPWPPGSYAYGMDCVTVGICVLLSTSI